MTTRRKPRPRVVRPATVYRRMFERYPTLFRTRLDAIDHLWCVLGNGYHWVDGGLVQVPPDRRRRRPTYREVLAESRALTREPIVLDALRKVLRRECRLPIGPVSDRARPHRFYELSAWSTLRTVPRDVRPEWLAAAIEAADAVATRAADTAQRAEGARIAAALRRRRARRG